MNLKGRDLKDRAAALQNHMPELSLAPGRWQTSREMQNNKEGMWVLQTKPEQISMKQLDSRHRPH